MSVTIHHGDSREVLKTLADASVDSVVCDPPYALVSIGKRFGKDGAAPAKSGKSGVYTRASSGFMGQKWDVGDTAFDPDFWREVLRVLKPGAHVVAFGGTRTYHRLVCAIEDAGFEIRDQIAWLYGSGFPKSHDVAKGIDRAHGAKGEFVATGAPVKRMIPGADQHKEGWEKTNGREYTPGRTEAATEAAKAWHGWGTALKPALEPIVLARKPLQGTAAANVLAHGTGALNVDGCRVPTGPADDPRLSGAGVWKTTVPQPGDTVSLPRGEVGSSPLGRWPANVVHDGSDEVVRSFPNAPGQQRAVTGEERSHRTLNAYGDFGASREGFSPRGDEGSAARFFYSAKADAEDRLGSKHPTVKPVDLMRWLCRLVTPPGGLVLDPFAGTGTTGLAALNEGFSAILIEREERFVADINRRLAWARGEAAHTGQIIASRKDQKPADGLPLFGEVA